MQNKNIKRRASKYLPEAVYGGTDGAVTTFGVMAGAAGAGLDPSIVLILGFANLFSDGISMASANYLSEDSKVSADKMLSIKKSFITFTSFVIAGLIPLLPFIYAAIYNKSLNVFVISTSFTLLAFLIIGVTRGAILNKSKCKLGLQTLTLGAVCALVAFYVGKFISLLV